LREINGEENKAKKKIHYQTIHPKKLNVNNDFQVKKLQPAPKNIKKSEIH